VIGNLKYDYSDPINASLEVGRRGYEVIIRKNKKFYPDFDLLSLKDRWKEHFSGRVKNWRELFELIKNSKVRYRVPLDELPNSSFGVFSLDCKQSKVVLYKFTCVDSL
jgi:hypothetical protein